MILRICCTYLQITFDLWLRSYASPESRVVNSCYNFDHFGYEHLVPRMCALWNVDIIIHLDSEPKARHCALIFHGGGDGDGYVAVSLCQRVCTYVLLYIHVASPRGDPSIQFGVVTKRIERGYRRETFTMWVDCKPLLPFSFSGEVRVPVRGTCCSGGGVDGQLGQVIRLLLYSILQPRIQNVLKIGIRFLFYFIFSNLSLSFVARALEFYLLVTYSDVLLLPRPSAG